MEIRMTISAAEAREALREIDESADRSRTFKGYRLAAPYFFIWGAIWVVCYGASGIDPRAGLLWLPATLLGTGLSIYVTRRNRAQQMMPASYGRMTGASFLALGLLLAATYAILPPHSVNQMNAFPALIAGLIYSLAGIWTRRSRLLVVGAVIAATTMIGFFYLGPWLAFWLAAIGGGSLILTGFWMRQA
jgi:hypothetical protein